MTRVTQRHGKTGSNKPIRRSIPYENNGNCNGAPFWGPERARVGGVYSSNLSLVRPPLPVRALAWPYSHFFKCVLHAEYAVKALAWRPTPNSHPSHTKLSPLKLPSRMWSKRGLETTSSWTTNLLMTSRWRASGYHGNQDETPSRMILVPCAYWSLFF